MLYDDLNENNFVIYAAKHYINHQCMSDAEFFDDCKRFKYLKRLFNQYQATGEIKERLVINHLIVLSNIFEPIPLVRMLFLKLRGFYPFLKPFLLLLNLLPQHVPNIDNINIYTGDITIDDNIVELLRKI